jgi:hypothetical protein
MLNHKLLDVLTDKGLEDDVDSTGLTDSESENEYYEKTIDFD